MMDLCFYILLHMSILDGYRGFNRRKYIKSEKSAIIYGDVQGRRNWGGRRGSCPPCLLLGGARGAKVPFKYKEYYITVSFQGAFS